MKESPSAQLQDHLVNLLRRNGWKVQAEVRVKDQLVDLLARKPGGVYVVELKIASEGRRDRLVPLMAQAILEAQSASAHLSESAAPLAVVAAPHIRDAVVREVREFARRHGPDVAIGLLDLDGLQLFSGPGLEALNVERRSGGKQQKAALRAADPFSDLNQWMLKVLLARYLPENARLLHAPAVVCQNASELAKVAQVSLMSASRFVRLMKELGFLHEDPPLRFVRVDELLQRWQSSYARPIKEVPAQWVLGGQADAVPRALKAYGEFACLGLFAAADALGYGFVQGAPVHILIQRVDARRLRQMRLVPSDPGQKADVMLRVPSAPESVFRGMLALDALKVSDVLQVWLDVARHPARGEQQADHLWKRVIQPMIRRAQSDAS